MKQEKCKSSFKVNIPGIIIVVVLFIVVAFIVKNSEVNCEEFVDGSGKHHRLSLEIKMFK